MDDTFFKQNPPKLKSDKVHPLHPSPPPFEFDKPPFEAATKIDIKLNVDPKSDNTLKPKMETFLCKTCNDTGYHKFNGYPCSRCTKGRKVKDSDEHKKMVAQDELSKAKFDKFVVFKTEELNELPYELKEGVRKALDVIAVNRINRNKPADRQYVVINTDECYIGDVIEIMKNNNQWG